MFQTTKKRELKPDIILKNFWRNNEHFADVFNAALFEGKQVIKPEDLVECDTDLSSILKFNGYVQTVQKVLDVVKKTAYGIDFIIWGLENQSRIHYAMPLRHMIGDSFLYLKEYQEIAARNKLDKNFISSDEFLSNFKKTDRLHPVISLCIYYGEEEWDGPFCLKDMLKIPEKLEPLICDYKLNLLQIRKSEGLKLKNMDVQMVFNISRFIYEHNFEKIAELYKDKSISVELGAVIGTITGNQNLIAHVLKAEESGGEIYMCKALEELVEKGRLEGIQTGIQTGIRAYIRICKKFYISQEDTIKNIAKEFSVSAEDAAGYVRKYW